MPIYDILPTTNIPRNRPQVFSYRAASKLAIGALVNIPLGRSTTVGIVWKEHTGSAGKLKDVRAVAKPHFFSARDHAFLTWLAHYYLTPETQLAKLFVRFRLGRPTKKLGKVAPSGLVPTVNARLGKIFAGTGPALIIDESEQAKFRLYAQIAFLAQQKKKTVLLLTAEESLRQVIQNNLAALGVQALFAEEHDLTAPVQIGLRSAIFGSYPNLGAIIVDREDNPHHKSEEQAPHYDARRSALALAQLARVPLFLESCAPRIATHLAATKERWPIFHHRLQKKITTHMVDSSVSMPHYPLAPSTVAALQDTIAQNGKTLLLAPRPGYASALQCSDCKHIFACPTCGKSLLFYQRGVLICPLGDGEWPTPSECPHCHGTTLRPLGAGTERLNAVLKALFPTVPIFAITQETKAAQRKAMAQQLTQPQSAIVIGTSAALRPDLLPPLQLAVMLSGDHALYLPDYRASEQLFVQLAVLRSTLVAGGALYVQSSRPTEPLLVTALAGHYASFAQRELRTRRALGYPPFRRLVVITSAAPATASLRHEAEQITAFIQEQWHAPVAGPLVDHRGHLFFIVKAEPNQRLVPIPLSAAWWLDVEPEQSAFQLV